MGFNHLPIITVHFQFKALIRTNKIILLRNLRGMKPNSPTSHPWNKHDTNYTNFTNIE